MQPRPSDPIESTLLDQATRRDIEADCIALSHAFAYHLDHKD